jgi:hypothetical protein
LKSAQSKIETTLQQQLASCCSESGNAMSIQQRCSDEGIGGQGRVEQTSRHTVRRMYRASNRSCSFRPRSGRGSEISDEGSPHRLASFGKSSAHPLKLLQRLRKHFADAGTRCGPRGNSTRRRSAARWFCRGTWARMFVLTLSMLAREFLRGEEKGQQLASPLILWQAV